MASEIVAKALHFPAGSGVGHFEPRVVAQARASVAPVVEPLPLPKSFRRSDLEYAGFVGWRTWEQLCADDFTAVPTGPAAYVIHRVATTEPAFLDRSTGGNFKGLDPTVPIETLKQNWIANCHVVYVGKADVARRRLKEFAGFGAGEPVAHWGGRYIWQLGDWADLLVAWHPITWDETPREYEERLLEQFAALHGARPFANLTG